MNRLGDMGNFPAVVNAGATVNVLMTVLVTWLLVPHYPQVFAPLLWTGLVLLLNLTPVFVLRQGLTPATPYPTLRTMNFVRDQHKFSDWVYLAASANMAFWILCSWAVFVVRYRVSTLICVLLTAATATYSPVLLRLAKSRP